MARSIDAMFERYAVPRTVNMREAKGLILGARRDHDFSNQRNWPA